MVYANGEAVAWCIYLWEWEDIVTHYCQSYSTEECDGKEYVKAVLEKQDNRYPALPHAPFNVQKMRSTPARNIISVITLTPQIIPHFSATVCMVHRGFVRGVFRPPSMI